MATLVALLAVSGLQGCNDVYKLFDAAHPAFANHSAYPDGFFLQVWAETEDLSRTDISLEGITVTVYDNAGAFADACPDIQGLGCSDPSNVSILGAVGTNAIDVGTEVAHQLGHIRYWQHGDGDGRHAHAEWFGENGVVEQVRALLVNGGIQ